jgi:hypothetical protein
MLSQDATQLEVLEEYEEDFKTVRNSEDIPPMIRRRAQAALDSLEELRAGAGMA